MRWRSPYLPLLVLSLFTVLLGGAVVSGFKICAYNLQKFNKTKASDFRVMHTLTRILSRCDISLLQEVVDPDGAAVKLLLDSLNRYEKYSYKQVSSESLGNSPKDMQQYVFIYRTETVKVKHEYQYKAKDAFVREPFTVYFQSGKAAIKDFVLVALHTEPRQAVQEIDRLYDVFQEVVKKWNNKNVMFLGDFHASCAYMTRANKKNIRLFTNSSFSWLIGDKVDTTVTDETNCAYDRIVVHGTTFLRGISPLSAKAFNFIKEFRLTRTKALEISDHLPVEVTLKSSAPLILASPLLVLLSLSLIVQSCLSTL